MSLILDALKRSRSEQTSVPGVDTYHAPLDVEPTWRRYLPWVALVLALLLVAWLLLERSGEPSGENPVGEGAPAPAVATGLPPAPRQAVPVSARPTGGQAATVPVATAPAQPVRAPAPRPVAAAPVAAPAAVPQATQENDAAVADLYRARGEQLKQTTPQEPAARRSTPQASPDAARQVEELPVDLEGMLNDARAELESGEFVEHPAPFISSLSQQARNPIPTILYQRHAYSGQSGRASVVMNGKTLRAGGSPAAGVKLEEILPNSAVLSYSGTQFRLRALNSWVNL